MAAKVTNVSDPYVVEMKAAVRALTWAAEMGFRDIVVEGDAIGAVQKLNSTDDSFSAVTNRNLKLQFRACLFSHVRRGGKIIAHELAKHALSLDSFIVWIEDVPDLICQFVPNHLS